MLYLAATDPIATTEYSSLVIFFSSLGLVFVVGIVLLRYKFLHARHSAPPTILIDTVASNSGIITYVFNLTSNMSTVSDGKIGLTDYAFFACTPEADTSLVARNDSSARLLMAVSLGARVQSMSPVSASTTRR